MLSLTDRELRLFRSLLYKFSIGLRFAFSLLIAIFVNIELRFSTMRFVAIIFNTELMVAIFLFVAIIFQY